MRVLILATRPTDPMRGDPSATPLLIRALTESGHRVDLVCAGDEPLRSFDTLTVWPVHADRSRGAPGFAARTYEAARAARPDLVVAHRAHLALGRSVAACTKSVFVPLFDESPSETGPAQRVKAVLESRLIRAAEACIGFGPIRSDEAVRLGARRSIELPGVTGVDPHDRPASGWLRRHLGLAEGVLAVAWGDLGPEHGTDALIEGVKVAADADADVHAAIFGGDQTTQDRYEAKAERLGIHNRVHLLGLWPASKLGALLPEADMLVDATPDEARTPRAVYSFLAAHRAVILAEGPGRERLVRPGACLFAPPDRLGIGHALSELALRDDLRLSYAAAGGAAAEASHTFESFAEAAVQPLERLVPERGTAGQDTETRRQGLGA